MSPKPSGKPEDAPNVNDSMGATQSYSPEERLAASAVIAILGGLVLAKASANSLDRALVFWIVLAPLAGFVLGRGSNPYLKSILRQSALPGFLFPAAFLGYLVVRWLADRIKNPEASLIRVMPISSTAVDPGTTSFVVAVSVLACIAWMASLILIALAANGAGPLTRALANLYGQGPDGVEKISKTTLAIAGLISAIVVVWAAIGS